MTPEEKVKVATETYTLNYIKGKKLHRTLKSKKGIIPREVLIIINIKDYG